MSDAILSECGLYRYFLSREWSADPPVVWIMLNPSTADAEKDDPTIRRCIGFAKRWGYGAIEVYNLYALRSPNPQDLIDSFQAGIDPVGPENLEYLAGAMEGAKLLVVAWGAHPRDLCGPGSKMIARHAPKGSLRCLGRTRSGAPRHPLFVRYDQPLEPWDLPTPSPRREG